MPYTINADDCILIAENNIIYANQMQRCISLEEPIQQIYASKHENSVHYFCAETVSNKVFLFVNSTSEPRKITLPNSPKIRQVVFGESYAALLTQNGKIYICEENKLDQLGMNDVNNQTTLTKLDLKHLNITKIKSVASGANHRKPLSTCLGG